MISCAEAVRQLWEYLDGTAAADDRERIEEHLAFCRRCCGEVQFAEELSAFLVRHADDELPADVRTRLVATIDDLEEGR